jgi:hypothetical protein
MGSMLIKQVSRLTPRTVSIFGATVKQVRRDADDTHWVVEFEKDGKLETAEYDKVALCHGYQTTANVPVYEGQEKFEGTIMHTQAFREYESVTLPSLSIVSRRRLTAPWSAPQPSKTRRLWSWASRRPRGTSSPR